MRVQRFLAVRIAIAPEGLERNSDQIRSSILVLKGTRCKKNAGNPATSSRTSDAVPRLATRRAGRTAARFGYLRGAAGTSAVGGRPAGGGGGRPAGRPAGGGHHAKRWTRWVRFQFQSGRRENARIFFSFSRFSV